MTSALTSAALEVEDAFAANELFQQNGWTDGLPVVPPTEEGVLRFLAAVKLQANDTIGVEPVRRRRITAEKVAIAALMAGCLPEYMPVVVAIIKALCKPELGLHGSTASTGGSAPFIVVNGPIRLALGMNTTHNALANASRANATIGRSVRLFLLNVLGGVPGQLDRSTLGHPGKFTFCVAEDEEGTTWLPLSVERGVPAGTSAVTVMAVESPHQIMNEWTHDPKEICDTYAAAIRGNMLTYSIWEGNYAVVIPKQHRDIFAESNWTKANIREYFSKSPVSSAANGARWARLRSPGARMKTRSTAHCARPTTCSSSLREARLADSPPSCRRGTARNRSPLPNPSSLDSAYAEGPTDMTLMVLDPRQAAEGEALRMAPLRRPAPAWTSENRTGDASPEP